MMPPRSILTAVDFSQPSRVALEFAARMARQCQATLHVLHVENLTRFTARAMTGNSTSPHVHIVTGDAWRTICDIAEREQVELIVLGMHGMSGAAHALFGSTTESKV